MYCIAFELYWTVAEATKNKLCLSKVNVYEIVCLHRCVCLILLVSIVQSTTKCTTLYTISFQYFFFLFSFRLNIFWTLKQYLFGIEKTRNTVNLLQLIPFGFVANKFFPDFFPDAFIRNWCGFPYGFWILSSLRNANNEMLIKTFWINCICFELSFFNEFISLFIYCWYRWFLDFGSWKEKSI